MKEVLLPKLGESILSAKVMHWFKKEGDFVELDEPLVEVSTDKVNSEIPSPFSGKLGKILAEVDQELEVGAPLCLIVSEESTLPKSETVAAKPEATLHQNDDYLSPAVVRMANEAGVSLEELKKISGSGGGGRVTKRDLEDYLGKRQKPCPLAKPRAEESGVERVKMTGMRKAIAETMVRSFYQAPHASLVIEVDMTAIQKRIKEEKEEFLKKHGVKITLTSYMAEAIAQTLKEYPYLNASLEEETIVLKRHVNLGIAVSVEKGIMVPVIKNCHKLTLPEIAQEVAKLSEKARTEALSPDDVQQGTITMTNFGMSGVSIGIPIIHHPEVAIVGIGALQKKVVALPDDTFGIRAMMNVCLTFDHRIIDGMYGCSFLNSLKNHLEAFS